MSGTDLAYAATSDWMEHFAGYLPSYWHSIVLSGLGYPVLTAAMVLLGNATSVLNKHRSTFNADEKYQSSVRRAVLTWRAVLSVQYAMRSTDIAYCTTRRIRVSTSPGDCAVLSPYALATRCPVLTWRMVLFAPALAT
eukprot:458488-Rhodomonas_salina.9